MNVVKHAAVTCLIVLFCTALAQAKPNFSGSWKMNPARSSFGEIPTPASLVQQITHNEPNIKVATEQAGEMGKLSLEYSYTTDGKECVNSFQGTERKSRVRWDGDTLVIESKMDLGGNPITVVEKWNLSEDGKTLTNQLLLEGPEGETSVKTVLEKQ